MLGLAVAGLSGAGAVARFLVDRTVQRRIESVFPLGTLVVNLSAALVLGVLSGIGARHGLAPVTLVLLSAGFFGGYSTFSTWVWETLALSESGALAEAAANVGGTFILGLLVAAAGWGLGSI